MLGGRKKHSGRHRKDPLLAGNKPVKKHIVVPERHGNLAGRGEGARVNAVFYPLHRKVRRMHKEICFGARHRNVENPPRFIVGIRRAGG